VLGEGPGRLDAGGAQGDAIAERSDAFDPFLAPSDTR
jgi:hypothetical protein